MIPRESEAAKDKPAITEVPKEKPKGPIMKAISKPSAKAEVSQENQDKGKLLEKSKVDSTSPPVHPYANIPEVCYAPPATKNFGMLVEKPLREKESMYKTVASIAEKHLVEDVYKRALQDTKIVLTIKELLNISPEFRKQFRRESMP